jgi:hypothetical protein
MENKKLVEQFTMTKRNYLEFCKAKNMAGGEKTVSSDYVSFEEFKRALIVLTLQYLPEGRS